VFKASAPAAEAATATALPTPVCMNFLRENAICKLPLYGS
jgi:hypothetical protein